MRKFLRFHLKHWFILTTLYAITAIFFKWMFIQYIVANDRPGYWGF